MTEHHHHHHHGLENQVDKAQGYDEPSNDHPTITTTASTKEVTEHNRKYWNDFASSYLAHQWQRDMVDRITVFIRSNISWLGVDFVDSEKSYRDGDQKVRVLDYACGPGIITNALGTRATEYIGVDLSENMVKAYSLRFSPETKETADINAKGFVGNFLDEDSPGELNEPEFFDFDVVAVGMGFHHFPHLELSTKRLVERLKPGGVLMITDIVKHGHDDKSHAASHTIMHHGGFGEDQVKQLFGSAGLEDVRIVQMEGQVKMGEMPPMNVFMARGRKR